MDSALDLVSNGIAIGFGIVEYVLVAFALMVIAKKDGLKNTWFAWIPILNVVLMLEIAGLELWYIILFLIPCVNIVVWVYVWWEICESRGKPGALGLLMLVPIANLLLPLYLALSD